MNNDEIVIGAIRSEVPDINGGGIGRVLPISPVGAISPPGDDFARHFANVAPDAIVVDQHVRRAVPVRQFLEGGGGRIVGRLRIACRPAGAPLGKIRSEEHTSELQSLMRISYAVFCLKKKT